MLRSLLLVAAIAVAGCAGPEPAPEPLANSPTETLSTILFDSGAPVRPGAYIIALGTSVGVPFPMGAVCTANFLFQNETDLFFGTSAHCFGREPELGQRVAVGYDGSDWLLESTLAYSSWSQMDGDHQRNCNSNLLVSIDDSELCWNDFALLRIDPEHYALVHPAPTYGTIPSQTATAIVGDTVWTVGGAQSRVLVRGELDARDGVVWRGGEWGRVALFTLPGTSGDSGSPIMSGDAAVGVMTYMHLAPPGANGFADLGMVLDAAADAGHPVELVTSDATSLDSRPAAR